jgi:hypothetical protein
MAAKKTPWLTYGLLAGGAYAAYLLYQNYVSGQTAAAATTTPATAPVTSLPPAGGTLTNAPVPSQQLPVSTTIPTLPSGITAAVYSVVQSWAQDDGRAPVLQMAAAEVPSEYAGMYDLITNYWDKNIAPGATQVTFWNALRAKYDPGDAIW